MVRFYLGVDVVSFRFKVKGEQDGREAFFWNGIFL